MSCFNRHWSPHFLLSSAQTQRRQMRRVRIMAPRMPITLPMTAVMDDVEVSEAVSPQNICKKKK